MVLIIKKKPDTLRIPPVAIRGGRTRRRGVVDFELDDDQSAWREEVRDFLRETDLHLWSERAKVTELLGGNADVAAGWLQRELGLIG
jgi:hypothetical protein